MLSMCCLLLKVIKYTMIIKHIRVKASALSKNPSQLLAHRHNMKYVPLYELAHMNVT